MNVNEYLKEHNTTEIIVGQSGADVYEIDGKYILKHVVRQKLQNEQFDTYSREALFYQSMGKRRYLPEVLKAEVLENEILILMKKYGRPERSAINAEMIHKLTKALAALHTDQVPSFLQQDKEKADPLSDQMIAECLS